MSLATRCPACGTIFRVVQDQLKVSEGWVRCGQCHEVFHGIEALFDLDSDPGIAARRAARNVAPPPPVASSARGLSAAAAPAHPRSPCRPPRPCAPHPHPRPHWLRRLRAGPGSAAGRASGRRTSSLQPARPTRAPPPQGFTPASGGRPAHPIAPDARGRAPVDPRPAGPRPGDRRSRASCSRPPPAPSPPPGARADNAPGAVARCRRPPVPAPAGLADVAPIPASTPTARRVAHGAGRRAHRAPAPPAWRPHAPPSASAPASLPGFDARGVDAARRRRRLPTCRPRQRKTSWPSESAGAVQPARDPAPSPRQAPFRPSAPAPFGQTAPGPFGQTAPAPMRPPRLRPSARPRLRRSARAAPAPWQPQCTRAVPPACHSARARLRRSARLRQRRSAPNACSARPELARPRQRCTSDAGTGVRGPFRPQRAGTSAAAAAPRPSSTPRPAATPRRRGARSRARRCRSPQRPRSMPLEVRAVEPKVAPEPARTVDSVAGKADTELPDIALDADRAAQPAPKRVAEPLHPEGAATPAARPCPGRPATRRCRFARSMTRTTRAGPPTLASMLPENAGEWPPRRKAKNKGPRGPGKPPAGESAELAGTGPRREGSAIPARSAARRALAPAVGARVAGRGARRAGRRRGCPGGLPAARHDRLALACHPAGVDDDVRAA